MAPTLQSGDYVISRKTRRVTPHKIYIINHSELGTIIKRLQHVDDDGQLIFQSDNKAGNSGHILGRIKKAQVKSYAFLRISNKGINRL